MMESSPPDTKDCIFGAMMEMTKFEMKATEKAAIG
jgi:hypothetical protein